MPKKNLPAALSEYFSQMGKRGGQARMVKMTAAERSEVARKAAAVSAKVRAAKAKKKPKKAA